MLKTLPLVLLLVSICRIPASGQTSSDYHYVNGMQELAARLDSLDRMDNPGFAMLVGRQDGILMTHASGVRDLESQAEITLETPFYVASIGKTFTSWAILYLYEQDLLRLESTLDTWFPSFPSFASEIRVMHLLNHTSGLPDLYDAANADDITTNAKVVQFVESIDSLHFAPGVNYAYSNTAYVLLAEIIEQITGLSYGQFLRQTFFEPLGMEHTFVIERASDLPADRAVGYSPSDSDWTENDYVGRYTTGAGGTYSTVGDLYLWYQAMMSHRFIGPGSTKLAMTPPVTDSGRMSWMSMGWFDETFGRGTPEVQGIKAIGAIGQLNGFIANLHVFPDHDLVFIYASNAGDFLVGPNHVAAAFLKRMERE